MRSFVALITCIGCIAWIHSCEKRLLGVRLEKNNITPYYQPQQLPVATLPATVPAHYISRVTTGDLVVPAPAPVASHLKNRTRLKKQTATPDRAIDSLLFNLAMIKGQYNIFSNTTP